ncbi:MAG: PEP/pyruvate-binding domain-containing protein [Nanoarchaeota archaeon]|nr:PEP/pyruvate-binding domain-containing protein [Nanoarchaeota archaeon]MBU1269571.1 PEP/pyruvate-binding domain-containing protein [Nanoarchaeota archaeon]MBU1604697.1 PEP/pyruvate-binding domain-containing protein [Nanoarchaeota archaeon]MBU2443832.1 PEP/pyruvate-binding domain-containing protein [Nanoarchaeota archaeon]
MDNILTLNKINRSDSDIVGFKAVDLAALYNKKLNIPICFVIKSSMFDEFIESNNIKQHLENALKNIDYSNKNSLNEACAKISEIIMSCEFPQDMQNEISESYETLAIDMDHLDISKLVTTIEKPFLTIIGSPNYLDYSENNDCVFQNIRGKNNLLKAIKSCWVTLYTPKSLIYRKNSDIDTKEKMGVIVQRMIDSKVSAQTYTDENEVTVKTFFGFQDYENEFGKDIVVFLKDKQAVKNSKINFQEFQLARDPLSEILIKKPLKNDGEKQKVNDKDIEEIARITKKIENIIEKPIKTFMTISKNKMYILFVNRIVKFEEEVALTTSSEEDAVDQITDEVPLPDDDERESPEDKITDEVLIPKPEYYYTSEEEQAQLPKPQKTKVEPKENGIEIEEVDFDDDVAFLEEIEKYEQETEKEDEIEEKAKRILKEVREIDNKITIPKKDESDDEETSNDEGVVSEKENDDFIFSDVEESSKSEDKYKETKSKTILEKDPAKKIEEAHEKIKHIIVLSDEAIFHALSKKHETLLGSKPASFEEAIMNLKQSVRIPFIHEIKRVHKMRQKIENGEEYEIEEGTIALRTAKNFLTMFS